MHIRYIIRRDLPAIMAIETRSYVNPWTEDEFVTQLRQRNTIGMCVEIANNGYDVVAGYVIYELHKNRLHILNMAVEPGIRRWGVGRFMILKLSSKLAVQGRNRVEALVRETNLPAQLFFKAMGFRATNVIRNAYDDSDEDAYSFVLRAKEGVPA